MELDSHKLLGVGGDPADVVQEPEYFKKNLSLNYYRNGVAMSTHAVANYMRGEKSANLRRGMAVVDMLLAGYDEDVGPSLYFIDYLASMQKLDKGAHGYAGFFVNSLLDAHWKPGMTLDEGLKLMALCTAEMKTGFAINSKHAREHMPHDHAAYTPLHTRPRTDAPAHTPRSHAPAHTPRSHAPAHTPPHSHAFRRPCVTGTRRALHLTAPSRCSPSPQCPTGWSRSSTRMARARSGCPSDVLRGAYTWCLHPVLLELSLLHTQRCAVHAALRHTAAPLSVPNASPCARRATYPAVSLPRRVRAC